MIYFFFDATTSTATKANSRGNGCISYDLIFLMLILFFLIPAFNFFDAYSIFLMPHPQALGLHPKPLNIRHMSRKGAIVGTLCGDSGWYGVGIRIERLPSDSCTK